MPADVAAEDRGVTGVDWIPESASALETRMWSIWREAACELGMHRMPVRWVSDVDGEITMRLIPGKALTFAGEIWYVVLDPSNRSNEEMRVEAVTAITRMISNDSRLIQKEWVMKIAAGTNSDH